MILVTVLSNSDDDDGNDNILSDYLHTYYIYSDESRNN